MVCADCEKKQKKVITPDTWKAGARNTTEFVLLKFCLSVLVCLLNFLWFFRSGGRIGGENRLLRRRKMQPYQQTCRICKKALMQPGVYCQQCAYKRGVCAMCGKKILDTSEYRQRSV